MKLSIKLVVSLAVAAGLILGYILWSRHEQGVGEARATVRYELAISQQKTRAATALALETAKVNTATKALNDFKTARELQDAQNKRTVAGLERRLAALAGPAGRLRDPNASAATGCGRGSGGTQGTDPASTADRAGDAAETGGLFSAGATELLQRLTREADDINVAYASCRPDALNLREALK